MSIYTDIRDAVSARHAFEAYSGPVGSGNKACCIWHDDQHPSLSFKGQYCKCFSCGNGGSAIDVTMQLFGLKPWDAALKLNSDFNLGLSAEKYISQRSEHQRRRQIDASLSAWTRKAHITMSSYFRLLSGAIYDYAPQTPDDAEHPLFIEALTNKTTVEANLDALDADNIRFFKQSREVIDKYASRLHYWRERGISV